MGQQKNNLDKYGRSVLSSNEANTSLLLKYIFRSGMGQKILTSKNKKGGGATLYHDNSSPEGANNINFPVKVLNFNSIS